jgi:hypothetical protein
MKKTFFIVLLILDCIFLSCCCGGNSSDYQYVVNQDAGVMVRGYCCDGYIQNLNDFPVIIKQVWQFRGETTQWIRKFNPGFRKNQYISHQHGFYITDMDGKEIGFINPQKEGCKK